MTSPALPRKVKLNQFSGVPEPEVHFLPVFLLGQHGGKLGSPLLLFSLSLCITLSLRSMNEACIHSIVWKSVFSKHFPF